MRLFTAFVVLVLSSAGPALAVDPEICRAAEQQVTTDVPLPRLAQAIKDKRPLDILVLGAGSSLLPGPNGAAAAYPARLQDALARKFPDLKVKVTTNVTPGRTAGDMGMDIPRLMVDARPVLVIWQTGTVDAMKGVDVDDFRAVLEQRIEQIQAAGADVVLMNMQYSPRTESMIAIGSYNDTMRLVAQQNGVPLFDRFAIMKHWSELGSFDLSASTKASRTAEAVHDCIGQLLAYLLVTTVHSARTQPQTSQ